MDIVADGFLYNMVRSIVGTLVNVGRDKWTADDVARILAAQDRSIAGCTAPACGLYLVQVWYDPIWEILDAPSNILGDQHVNPDEAPEIGEL